VPGFHLLTSNCLETLADDLAGRLAVARHGSDPLVPETIVINSRGMEAWLQQRLARHSPLRVQANLRFALPTTLLRFLLRHLESGSQPWPDVEEARRDPFDRDILEWRVFAALGALPAHDDAYQPLRAYLTPTVGDAERRRVLLARQIADAFDQYQLFRPAMLADWQRGGAAGCRDDDRWQPALWRRLAAADRYGGAAESGADDHQQPSLWRQLVASDDSSSTDVRPRNDRMAAFARLHDPVPLVTALPRIWVFGVSTMAPSYLALLRAAARRAEVFLYVRNPSPVYWLEDISPARRKRLLTWLQKRGWQGAEQELGMGNPLLTSMGRLVRDFLTELMEQCSGAPRGEGGLVDLSDDHLFREPAAEPASLLQALQQGIFHAEPPTPAADALATAVIERSDDSLLIHSCHSHLREVEVLHDRLLDWFSGATADAPRLPHQVIVMAPEIEEYVPFIEAVFRRAQQDADDAIPFSIADRRSAAASSVVQAFLTLLRLPELRLRASEVLDLLGVDPIAAARGLDEDDIRQIQQWIDGSNIRWGLDAAHRQELDLDILGDANSWEAGLDRLFAGYAFADSAAAPGAPLWLDRIAPYNEVEGGNAAALGRFAEFIGDLRRYRRALADDRTPAAWCELLTRMIDRFFAPDDASYAEIAGLQAALEALRDHAETGDVDTPVARSVIEAHLAAVVQDERSTGDFCRGAVTFCSMLPMRSIPADFIALLGMNDATFPRQDRRRGVDLMARQSLRCDRSLRLDDRYLFLEVLLSARARLHISYLGQGLRDNAERPPSTLVRELLGAVGECLGADSDVASSALVVQQPLHSHAARCFSGAAAHRRLASFSATAWAACESLADATDSESLALAADASLPVLATDDPLLTPDGEMLAHFYRGPGEFLLRSRLGLDLRDRMGTIDDDEPVNLDGLAGYALKQRIVAAQAGLGGEAPATLAQLQARLRAEGALPVGSTGEEWVAEHWAAVADYLATPIDGQPLATVLARPEPIPDLLLHARYAKLGAKDQVTALVRHLHGRQENPALRSLLVGADGTCTELADGEDTATIAADWALLIALYRYGLCRPLPFLARPAWAYAEIACNPRKNREPDLAAAAAAADQEWLGSAFNEAYDGVRRDANRYCFGTTSLCNRPASDTIDIAIDEPLPVCFEEIATRLYGMWRRWSDSDA
jgi:exodeoxyribonuclease V gamma subunit